MDLLFSAEYHRVLGGLKYSKEPGFEGVNIRAFIRNFQFQDGKEVLIYSPDPSEMKYAKPIVFPKPPWPSK